MMELVIITPISTERIRNVAKVSAEGLEGWFTMLPRHADYASALLPSILAYSAADGRESYVGVNGGALVKLGPEVRVATTDVIRAPSLAELERRISEEFEAAEEGEKKSRAASALAEGSMARFILELKEAK